jgi:septin family protein
LLLLQVLIVGDSGLGKTTLVKTLLSTPGERLQVRAQQQLRTQLTVDNAAVSCLVQCRVPAQQRLG